MDIFYKKCSVFQADDVTVSILIEQGADVLKVDLTGEAVIYLAKKLSERNSEKYEEIYKKIHQHLRLNYNTSYLSSMRGF